MRCTVVRQTGLQVQTLSFRAQSELCGEALLATLRKFSGDPTGAPTVLADSHPSDE